MSNPVFAAADLSDYQWKKRILLVLAPSDREPELKQQQAIATNSAADFAERDLTLIIESQADGPLHRKFGVKHDEFRVLLIGKDGHTALERTKSILAVDLFRIIDAMPMRRKEMRSHTR